MPEIIAFRFNPGSGHNIKYNRFIGNPAEAKFGMTKAQLFSAYKKCKEYGVKRFGVHTMVVSNSLDVVDLAETVLMMFTLAVEIKSETGISVEFVNMGGGIGVPYHPEDMPVDLEDLGYRVKCLYEEIVLPHLGLQPPQVKYECGEMVSGQFGWLSSGTCYKHERHVQTFPWRRCCHGGPVATGHIWRGPRDNHRQRSVSTKKFAKESS